MMAAELIDLMLSLSNLMEEESGGLSARGRVDGQAEIVEAKTRLVGQLETEIARLARETPDWMEMLNADTRQALSDASARLLDASQVNAKVLERQIEFSVEMMGAIAAEARRVTGRQSDTYSAQGGFTRYQAPAPISINARL